MLPAHQTIVVIVTGYCIRVLPRYHGWLSQVRDFQ